MASLVFVSNIMLAQSAANAAPKDTSADQPVTTMSVQVKVVSVFATARDKHGKIVNGLNKNDFKLSEDGRLKTSATLPGKLISHSHWDCWSIPA